MEKCAKKRVTYPCPSDECTMGPYSSEAVMRNHVRQEHRELMHLCNKRQQSKARRAQLDQAAKHLRVARRQAMQRQRCKLFALDSETSHLGSHEVAELL